MVRPYVHARVCVVICGAALCPRTCVCGDMWCGLMSMHLCGDMWCGLMSMHVCLCGDMSMHVCVCLCGAALCPRTCVCVCVW